ncbi:hypothetical protein LCGC14_0353780 [marine sediment metagenome]|uniref:Uncharacterized protein n=1 Tax=marine sediment metagenome TaxID=412755 RepID=A0A0F9VXG4_9ZZZZ
MATGVRAITKGLMRQWTTNLIHKHHTPVLVVGIGHDQEKGKISVISVAEMSNDEIAMMLRVALATVEKRGQDVHEH